MKLYHTIVADPPWEPRLHRNTVGRRKGPYRAGPQRYYPVMKVDQICQIIPPAKKKSHLWLWCINQHLDWGYEVARAWGFEPQQVVTWCKPTLGIGQFQCNTEQVLLCRKGGSVENAFGRTKGTWFTWPRRKHSEKPDDFYKLVEKVSPGPYLEMFARKERAGWDSWGNEVTASVKIGNKQDA